MLCINLNEQIMVKCYSHKIHYCNSRVRVVTMRLASLFLVVLISGCFMEQNDKDRISLYIDGDLVELGRTEQDSLVQDVRELITSCWYSVAVDMDSDDWEDRQYSGSYLHIQLNEIITTTTASGGDRKVSEVIINLPSLFEISGRDGSDVTVFGKCDGEKLLVRACASPLPPYVSEFWQSNCHLAGHNNVKSSGNENDE